MRKQLKIIEKKRVLNFHYRSIENWRVQFPQADRPGDFCIEVAPDIVMVFALTKKKQVVFINEYYLGEEKAVDSLVAGFVDPDKTPLATAKNELREEAGHESKKWVNLGKVMKSKYATGYCHFFLALDAVRIGEQQLEEMELIKVREMGLSDFIRHLRQGRINSLHGSLACYLALDYLKKL
ncbi:MAG TPA: NUDIX hydrolase [Patescibacteria group bacterium]|nr:NUDIX hydrolase [Patescibacteria group bacterium]